MTNANPLIDLHLPQQQPPQCNVIARIGRELCVVHAADGYYVYNRVTGRLESANGPVMSEWCRKELEAI